MPGGSNFETVIFLLSVVTLSLSYLLSTSLPIVKFKEGHKPNILTLHLNVVLQE